MSDAFDDILSEAISTKKIRPIGHFFYQQMKSFGQESALTPEQWDRVMDLALNSGPLSERDEGGFTPDNHLLADCAEACFRHEKAGMSESDAVRAALKEVPIDNGKRDPEQTLWAVIGGERGPVRRLMIKRKTWRSRKRPRQ